MLIFSPRKCHSYIVRPWTVRSLHCVPEACVRLNARKFMQQALGGGSTAPSHQFNSYSMGQRPVTIEINREVVTVSTLRNL